MASTRLDSTRDTLYTQWQRDVADARKARSAMLAQQQAGEMAQIEAKIAGEKDISKAGTNHDLEVARLKTQAEKEMEAMRIAASGQELERRIGADVNKQYYGAMIDKDMQVYKERKDGILDRQTQAAQDIAAVRGELKPEYRIDELATFLHESTTDKDGNKHSISPTNRSVLETMAAKAGYAPVYQNVGPTGRPLVYSHGFFGDWDSDVEKNNDIRFREVAKPKTTGRKLY